MKIKEWNISENYRSFFYQLLKSTKNVPLIQRVINFYGERNEFDFSLLSLIQHYGGPTPLSDWTYDIDISLFFAVEKISWQENQNEDDIDQYFSFYILNNSDLKLKSLAELSKGQDLSFKDVFESVRDPTGGISRLFYISDFEKDPDKKNPLTSVFNQNIIPQKGLFIFNPSRTKPLEEFFLSVQNKSKITPPFTCYNIRKNLGGYIRRKLASKNIITSFVYPNLYNDIHGIQEFVLNSYFKG